MKNKNIRKKKKLFNYLLLNFLLANAFLSNLVIIQNSYINDSKEDKKDYIISDFFKFYKFKNKLLNIIKNS